MKQQNEFMELNTQELKQIDGGGWMTKVLAHMFFGTLYYGAKAGEGLERSGFNHAGANK